MRKWFALFLMIGLIVAMAVPAASAIGTLRFTVVFKSDTLPADADAIVTKAGGTPVVRVPEMGIMDVTGPASLIKSLNAHPAILAASPSIEFKLAPAKVMEATVPEAVDTTKADLYRALQWDIKQVTDNGASWSISTGSHQTVVGIIDTGVSTQHPALKANLLGGRNFTDDGPGGSVDPADIEDRNGHGSHVAGAIAGNGRILGVGPNLGFRAYRVFAAEGGSPTSRIAQAMVAAVNDGVDVISMSLGGISPLSYTWTDPATGIVYRGNDVADAMAYRRALDYAVHNGVVVVVAAGNEATNIANPAAVTAYANYEYGPYGYEFWGATLETPGTLPGALTVSATGPSKSLSSYSNYGPGAIDISAPGGDFQRYPYGDWWTDMNVGAYKGLGYVWMAGTSMATPKVSAVAALVIDQAKARGEKLTPSQVVARLQQTSVDLGKTGYDPFHGYGFVNAYNALSGK